MSGLMCPVFTLGSMAVRIDLKGMQKRNEMQLSRAVLITFPFEFGLGMRVHVGHGSVCLAFITLLELLSSFRESVNICPT